MFSGYTFKLRAPPQLTHYGIEEPKNMARTLGVAVHHLCSIP